MNWRNYGIALRFTAVFIGTYLALNLLYGWWVEWQSPEPDGMTRLVAGQCESSLQLIGYEARSIQTEGLPSIHLFNGDRLVLNVFEGCNGLNVMIVFLSFLAATARRWGTFAWYAAAGCVILHVFNILRIDLLFWLGDTSPNLFHYFHKYLFTATIYGVVFLLWWAWQVRFAKGSTRASYG